MSYSRWHDSRWYCFWAASEGSGKETEVFEICNLTSFTYKDLSHHLDDCLEAAIDLENADTIHPVTPSEKEELKKYMQRFIQDIEDRYNGKRP